jgi:hypothetical protein
MEGRQREARWGSMIEELGVAAQQQVAAMDSMVQQLADLKERRLAPVWGDTVSSSSSSSSNDKQDVATGEGDELGEESLQEEGQRYPRHSSYGAILDVQSLNWGAAFTEEGIPDTPRIVEVPHVGAGRQWNQAPAGVTPYATDAKLMGQVEVWLQSRAEGGSGQKEPQQQNYVEEALAMGDESVTLQRKLAIERSSYNGPSSSRPMPRDDETEQELTENLPPPTDQRSPVYVPPMDRLPSPQLLPAELSQEFDYESVYATSPQWQLSDNDVYNEEMARDEEIASLVASLSQRVTSRAREI